VLAVLVGLLELFGGLALIVGFKARWAALALGVFTILASVLFHKFWAVAPEQQFVQQLMFMKNLAVAGGMFIVAALGAGPLSLDSRGAAAGARAALA
jgi:putative oxidoreductase